MDASRFDTWTRRHFGLAAGSAMASLLGLAGPWAAAKKRHKKKKRCTKLGRTCGGKRKCCRGFDCDAVGDGASPQTRCCKPNGAPCQVADDCCQPQVCSDGRCSFLISDRNAKANFGSVDPADMLERVRELPISTWNYRADDASIRHIGPMAQDFTAAFGVGADDRHIHPLDGQGVALAAIQGLADELARLHAENAALAARVAALEQA
jgi:hypothetical protein